MAAGAVNFVGWEGFVVYPWELIRWWQVGTTRSVRRPFSGRISAWAENRPLSRRVPSPRSGRPRFSSTFTNDGSAKITSLKWPLVSDFMSLRFRRTKRKCCTGSVTSVLTEWKTTFTTFVRPGGSRLLSRLLFPPRFIPTTSLCCLRLSILTPLSGRPICDLRSRCRFSAAGLVGRSFSCFVLVLLGAPRGGHCGVFRFCCFCDGRCFRSFNRSCRGVFVSAFTELVPRGPPNRRDPPA